MGSSRIPKNYQKKMREALLGYDCTEVFGTGCWQGQI